MEYQLLKEGEFVLVSDEQGNMPEGRRRLGLYWRDTRYLSILEMTVDGQKPRLLSSCGEQNYACDILLANPTIDLPNGMTARARTISIRRSRFLKEGLHERISFCNHNAFPIPLRLTLILGSDFYDIFEVRGSERERRGTLSPPMFAESRATLSYLGLDNVERRTEISFEMAPSKVELEEIAYQLVGRRTSTILPESIDTVTRTMTRPPCARLMWDLTLEPGIPLSMILHIVTSEARSTPSVLRFDTALAELHKSYDDWSDQCAVPETDHEGFNRVLQRSSPDLRLLMEPTLQGSVPVAGIPWFGCIMGRDSLITSLQTLMLNPQIAINTLRFLAKHQGQKVNPWHDEEPGKIIHEIRRGELANLDEIPFAAHYGSVDPTPLFLMVFAETMKWLDDAQLFEELLPAAKFALEWMENYGDMDGDGYLEYVSRSRGGLWDQDWTDVLSSVTYPDGTPVEPPVALLEAQGYAYKAMSDMAKLLRRKGDAATAAKLEERASSLRANFNRDFWLEDEQFFARALDANKKPVATVTSKPGHCLLCGIVDEEKAEHVVKRLVARDMASGWGIRTVSSKAQQFNPMSYQSGSIWPYENSLIIAGMRRYGYHEEAEEITWQLYQASLFFPHSRLPELFCGFDRDRDSFSVPAEYPASCSPQAWSAGSAILIFQSMLGLEVDASSKRVSLSPRLPSWLENASVRKLRIEKGTMDLYFERRGERTSFQVLRNDSGAEILLIPHRGERRS